MFFIQLLFIIIAIVLCLKIIKKNKRQAYVQSQTINTPPPFASSPFTPPPHPPLQPQPVMQTAVKRKNGCLSIFGVAFILLLIIHGIQQSEERRRPVHSETEQRLQEIKQQKNDLKKRMEKEIPDFVRLLYQQAAEIKKELSNANDSATKDYLMEELKDIASTFVYLDKEENDYKDILSELASIERTLVRLKESQKLFGAEYDEFMNQSRAAVTKAKAKMDVKINLEMDRNVALNDIQVQEKMSELLK